MKKLILCFIAFLMIMLSGTIVNGYVSSFKPRCLKLYNYEREPVWVQLWNEENVLVYSGIIESKEIVKLKVIPNKYRICIENMGVIDLNPSEKTCIYRELKEEYYKVDEYTYCMYWKIIKN